MAKPNSLLLKFPNAGWIDEPFLGFLILKLESNLKFLNFQTLLTPF